MNKLSQIDKALTVDKTGESEAADLKILASMIVWFSICTGPAQQ